MRLILFAILALLYTSSARADVTLNPIYGTGDIDATPAWNTAIAEVCVSPTNRTLRIPSGTYRFLTSPDEITCAANVYGETKGTTFLVMDYDPPSNGDGHFIVFTGQQDVYGGGIIRDLQILVGEGQHGGIALWLRAERHLDGPNVSLRGPHGMLIDNVIVSREVPDFGLATAGTWNYGVYLDGGANAEQPPGIAEGIRGVRIRDTSVAVAVKWSFLFYYAHGVRATMVDCWIATNDILYYRSQTGYTITQSCTVGFRS